MVLPISNMKLLEYPHFFTVKGFRKTNPPHRHNDAKKTMDLVYELFVSLCLRGLIYSLARNSTFLCVHKDAKKTIAWFMDYSCLYVFVV
jgi:hypothetical protein